MAKKYLRNKMNLPHIEILNKIHKFKHEKFGSVVVNCKINDVQYKLILLTADCESNQNLMEIIGRWRKENEIWFLSQFNVTTERTTKWFKMNLIEIQDRLLFIIEVENKYIGHVGLFRFDFEKNTCEIDNIVRGEPEYAGIMGDAVLNMMDWGKKQLDINSYLLKVVSDNIRAIKFYNRLGFIEVLKIPLIQVMGNDGLEWVEAPIEYKNEANRYYIVMKSVQ
jgi:RimJ/RimL family protein N-acetyltransferase